MSILLRPRRRFFSTPVFEAIRKLQSEDIDAAVRAFALEPQQSRDLASDIEQPVKNPGTAKILLAAIVWQQEATMSEDDVIEQRLAYEPATVEHILPQNPAAKSHWRRDFSEDFRKNYTHRLGNMTLLSHRINARISNGDFQRKRQEYAKSRLMLTRDLASVDPITEAFIRDRHTRLVTLLCRRWRLPEPT
ncbi:MAG: HNH endonuclease family protein [Polyangiales bacterium]